jgi:hypothetical protein
MLRYFSRISSFVRVFSSVMASLASRSLRARPSVPSASRAASIPRARSSSLSACYADSMSTFFTYCWVSVEAPSFDVLSALRAAARSMPMGSTPECS